MEHKMVTIPFDLETAKKIRKGERLGQIVAEKGRNRAEIVYEDDLCNAYPLLVVIHSIPVLADWFWSSTESSQYNAWYVYFFIGDTGSYSKYGSGRVRAVIDF